MNLNTELALLKAQAKQVAKATRELEAKIAKQKPVKAEPKGLKGISHWTDKGFKVKGKTFKQKAKYNGKTYTAVNIVKGNDKLVVFQNRGTLWSVAF